MLVLGHLGVTTGIVKKLKILDDDVDYRIVLVGSVLPDIVDKTIYLFLRENIAMGDRLIGHTLIFSLFIIMLGYIFFIKKRNKSILTLGISSLMHLILDSMWLFPSTLFYPLYGFKFPLNLVYGEFPKYLETVFEMPVLLIFEIIGGVILVRQFIFLKRKNCIKDFFKSGAL